jgi:hypothetical protein
LADHLKSSMSAEAEIDHIFTLTGRGTVLVLKEGFRGPIPTGGIIEGNRGTTTYSGPEFVDRISGSSKSTLAVIIDDEAKERFTPGEWVRFYNRR